MSNQIYPSQVRGLNYTVLRQLEDSVIVQEGKNFQSTRILQAINPRWHWQLSYELVTDNPLRPNPYFAYTDLQTFLGFLQARYNTYDDFLYLDPDDNFVGPGIITTGWSAGYPYFLGAIIVVGGHGQQVVALNSPFRSSLSQTPNFSVTGGTVVDSGVVWQDLGSYSSTGWPNPQASLQLVTDGTNWYSPIQRNLGGQFWEDVTDLASALTVYDNGTATTNYNVQWGGITINNVTYEGLYLKFGYTPTGPITATFNFYFRVRLEDNVQDFEKFANQMWTVGGEQGVSGKGYIRFMSSPPLLTSGSTASGPITLPVTPAPGEQVVVLYPQKCTFNNGSGIAFAGPCGQAYAQAGPNAFCFTELLHQYLGSGGGNAQFFGYALPPTIPPGAVTKVFTNTPYIAYYVNGSFGTGQQAAGSACIIKMISGGAPVGGQTNALGPAVLGQQNYINFSFDLMAQWNSAGHSSASFPYNLVQQQIQPFASIAGQYNQICMMFPSLIVYYT